MRTIRSEKGKLIVELTANDRDRIGALFGVIGADNGVPTPWWGSEDGTGQAVLDDEKFDRLFDEWNSLTDGPEARAFFTGRE